MAESIFATLEREVLNRRRFKSQAEAKMAIFPHAVNRRAIRTIDRRPTLARVRRLFEGSLVSDFI
jgi:hypothetical protein